MLIAHVDRSINVFEGAGSGRRLGTLRARTPWLRSPTTAWVEQVSADGRWGRIRLPWRADASTGWIALRDTRLRRTDLRVTVSLSRRVLEVHRGPQLLARMRAGIGAAGSPTPTGRFVVSDRVVPSRAQRSAFGTFAFGLSGIQPDPPPGWSGPAQLAIHGTGDPASIGRTASAGCVRIAQAGLELLRPLLRLGTPVVVER